MSWFVCVIPWTLEMKRCPSNWFKIERASLFTQGKAERRGDGMGCFDNCSERDA